MAVRRGSWSPLSCLVILGLAGGCITARSPVEPSAPAVDFERPMVFSRDAPVFVLDPGVVIGQTGVSVVSAEVEPGRALVVLAAQAPTSLEVVPRFFDGRGREVLAPYEAQTFEIAGPLELALPLPHDAVSTVGVSLVEQAAEPFDAEPATTRLVLTPEEFGALRYAAVDGLLPVGVGDPLDLRPKAMGWYDLATGELRYAIELEVLEPGRAPVRREGLEHLSYDEHHREDFVRLPPREADVVLASAVDGEAVIPLRTLVRGPVRVAVAPSSSAAYLGARIERGSDDRPLSEGPRPRDGGSASTELAGELTSEGWVERPETEATALPRRVSTERLAVALLEAEDGGVRLDPRRFDVGPSFQRTPDGGGIWLQQKPRDPVEGGPIVIPPTVRPTNGDEDGNVPPGVEPVLAKHSCVVAWVVSGGKGGHAPLAKGAKFADANTPLGTPSKEAVEEIAEGIQETNAILEQCGKGVQLHLCAVHVIDATKTEDFHMPTRTLADTLFDRSGVTGTKADGSKDPVDTLYDTIVGLAPFKAESARHSTCANVFFVRDVQDVDEPDGKQPNGKVHFTTGVGGETGGRGHKRPGGVVERADGSTIAHELVHGFGHGGHTDEKKAGEGNEMDKIRKEAKAAEDQAKQAEQEAERKRKEFDDANKEAERAKKEADDRHREQREAERALEAEKDRISENDGAVRRHKKKIALYEDKIANAKTKGLEEWAKGWRDRYRKRLKKARDRYWKRHETEPGPKKAIERQKAAERAAEKAQGEAEAERKVAEAKKKAADQAQEAAKKARAAASNLMTSKDDGTALTRGQCRIITKFIADNGMTCACD